MLKMIQIMPKTSQNYQIYQNYQNVAELIQNCVVWCKMCLWCHGPVLKTGVEERHHALADGGLTGLDKGLWP